MTNPKRAQHLAWRELGDHTLVIDSRINQEVHHFNEVGSFLWNLCDGTHSIEDISSRLQDEYDVSTETANKDISEFIKTLDEKKLLDE